MKPFVKPDSVKMQEFAFYAQAKGIEIAPIYVSKEDTKQIAHVFIKDNKCCLYDLIANDYYSGMEFHTMGRLVGYLQEKYKDLK